MQQVSLEEVERIARKCDEEGKDWHFHMLTPGCVFNPRDGMHAFVVEASADNEVFVAYTGERQFDLGEELVQMLHGESVLDEDREGSDELPEKVREMVERARNLNQGNVSWHHHNLFPDCVFNDHEGWCLVFEDPETGETIEHVSREEPVEALNRIETLYYDQ